MYYYLNLDDEFPVFEHGVEDLYVKPDLVPREVGSARAE